LGFIGIGSIVGRFLLGAIADLVGRRNLLAASFRVSPDAILWVADSYECLADLSFRLCLGSCYGGVLRSSQPSSSTIWRAQRSGIIGILYTAAASRSFLGPKLAGDVLDKVDLIACR